MTEHIRCRGWEDRQAYKDGRPIHWIKLHIGLLEDYNFSKLTEVQQAHIVKIWALAGKMDNKIPNDATWIAGRIGAKSKVDIKQLITSGFLALYETVRDGTDTPPLSVPREEERREEEIREERDKHSGDGTPEPTFWESNNLVTEFTAFKKMRTSIKAPLTDHAESLLISKLAKMQGAGHDIQEAINRSIEFCWKGVFEPENENDRDKRRNGSGKGHVRNFGETPADRNAEAERRYLSAGNGKVVGAND